ncbi:MAG: hypothetical protein FWE44_01485, partial [Defluviitaleaceae bacterium]|nr:hypothetical protein [Defluviitaleaceae bacterium]
MSKNLDKIKRSFLSNLPFKVAAVLIAFLLWFVVLNATDPIVNDDIRVTLDVRNVNSLTSEPIHRHLVNYEALRNTQITITVRGTQREIDAIRQNLTAYIDLSAAEVVSAAQTSTQFSTRVHVYGVSGNVLLQTHSPGNVTLQLDSIVTRYINVEFEPIGEIDAGYIAVWEEAVIEPNVLRVTGPSSSVDSIYKFLVEVNQEGLTESWRRTGFEPLAVTATGGHVATAHVQFGSV